MVSIFVLFMRYKNIDQIYCIVLEINFDIYYCFFLYFLCDVAHIYKFMYMMCQKNVWFFSLLECQFMDNKMESSHIYNQPTT